MNAESLLNNERLQRRLIILATVIALGAGAYWIYQRVTHVYSDDARIAADMINIATEVSGQLATVETESGARVKKGDILARIDARKTEFQLQALDASLSEVEARYHKAEAEQRMVSQQADGALTAARSRLDAARALQVAAGTDLDFKAAEWQRAQSLRERELMATQEWQRIRSDWRQAEQSAQKAKASVAEAEAAVIEAQALGFKVSVLDSELTALDQQLARLQAERGRLQVELEQHLIRAPVNGVIDQTFVLAGEHVTMGQRMLLMHDPGAIWVDAKVKETEVRHLKIGQTVAVAVDAYPGQTFNGTLARIGDAATSEFALLPSTNPSGNFTKITQRLPLKITVGNSDAWLRPGMMVEVAIDVRGS